MQAEYSRTKVTVSARQPSSRTTARSIAVNTSAGTSPVKAAQPSKRRSSRKATLQEDSVSGSSTLERAAGGTQPSREQAIALLAQCLPELAAGTSKAKGADAASALDFLQSANLTGALSRLEGSQESTSVLAQPTRDHSTQLPPEAQAVLAELRLPEGAAAHPLDATMPPKNPSKPKGRPPAKGSAAAKRRAKTAASGLTETAATEIAERLAQADPALLDSMIDAASQATAQPTADPAPGLEALGGNASAKLQAPTEDPTAHPDRANSTLASNDAALIAGGATNTLPGVNGSQEAPSSPTAAANGSISPPAKKRGASSRRSKIKHRAGASAAEMALAIEAARALEAPAEQAAGPAEDKAPAPKKKGPRKAAAVKTEGDDNLEVDALTEPPANGKPAARKRAPAKRKGAVAGAASLPEVKVEVKEKAAEGEAGAAPPAKRRRGPSKAKLAAEAAAAAAAQMPEIKDEESAEEPAPAKPKRARAPRKTKAAAAQEADNTSTVNSDVGTAMTGDPGSIKKKKASSKDSQGSVENEEAGADGEEVVPKPKRERKKKRGDPGMPPAFEIPSLDLLPEARATKLDPRPVPNLGYACLNMELREQRVPIFTNRDCVLKSYIDKGLPFVSGLVKENTKALAAIVHWNHLNGIRFFRMTSTMFPWCTEYEMEDLPDWEEIKGHLAFAGDLARAYDIRMTFHPSHFIKLAADNEDLLAKSLKEMEVHSKILDYMGYEPSVWNKTNIHIGGVYGDKQGTMERFAKNFKRLSPNAQKRLTLENDDWPSGFAVSDLLWIHKEAGIPIVFDFHHHKFCPGGLTEKEALEAAVKTWPEGIRPAVHWSESQEGRKPHAHSDYIAGPMNLHGLEKDVDVMIEAKCKEQTLLRFRELTSRPAEGADMAMKFV
ncbi:hypothetical protein WJX74_000567 [Apatococcus lobatus]|uniref:Uncharacterized protein n=1 Tax=Apatococcus lobatus TaxID=904363 RepID=A0AAW1RBS2_9CHLO